MPRFYVAFGQFFDAADKRSAYEKAVAALWGSSPEYGGGFGASVAEVPQDGDAVCMEVDSTTGIKHWKGADQ